MAGIQVRKKDIEISKCCKEGLTPMSTGPGENHIVVDLRCNGCLAVIKTFYREIRERSAT